MSVNVATKARLALGGLLVGGKASDGGAGAIAGTATPSWIKKIAAFTTGTITPGALVGTGTANTYTTPTAAVVSTQTVTGVKAGDIVIAIPPAGFGTAAIAYTCFVSAADTVKITIWNAGGATVTPGAGAWTILWLSLV